MSDNIDNFAMLELVPDAVLVDIALNPITIARDELLVRTDVALYAAKRAGRNRVARGA